MHISRKIVSTAFTILVGILRLQKIKYIPTSSTWSVIFFSQSSPVYSQIKVCTYIYLFFQPPFISNFIYLWPNSTICWYWLLSSLVGRIGPRREKKLRSHFILWTYWYSQIYWPLTECMRIGTFVFLQKHKCLIDF